MNTMNFIVWLFPVIFMLHDFEEIIMVEVWGSHYNAETVLYKQFRTFIGLAHDNFQRF